MVSLNSLFTYHTINGNIAPSKLFDQLHLVQIEKFLDTYPILHNLLCKFYDGHNMPWLLHV